jgi:hypothetical protein
MKMPNRSLAVLGAVIFLSVASQPGWSQESKGTILGRITDSSDRVVPAATVQVTNVETSVAVKTASNDAGVYYASFLIPGTYRITVEKDGFKTFVRDGIVVHVNDRLEINASLVIGTVSEKITVTEEAPLLDTTNASVGRVIGFRELRELPAEHGDPDNLIKLSLGVGFTDNPSKDQPWQSLNASYAMAGQRGALNEFTLDGTSNTLHDQGRGSVAQAWTPPGDAVAEYKVQTASFDATTGQTQGGVINVSLKSGTNQFHGTAYWGKETTSMNANAFFSNANNIPIAGLKYNRLGTTLSGPVIIPKLYNGRNKTFFMFTYENIHSTTNLTGSDAPVDTVPTDAQRGGDFSSLLKLGTNYQIYDPFSTQGPNANGRYTRNPLPGNIVPANQINPISKRIFACDPSQVTMLAYVSTPQTTCYYPQPIPGQGTIDGGNNYAPSSWPSRIPYHSELFKFDQVLGSKNRLMVRANFRHHTVIDSDQFGFNNPTMGAFFWNESEGYAIDDVHAFSSSFIMDVRVSVARFLRAQKPSPPGQNWDLTQLGFPSYIRDAIAPQFRQFPAILISDLTASSGQQEIGARTYLYKQTQTRELTVTFNKTRGNHDFKFGVDYRQYPDNQISGSNATDLTLSFGTTYTNGPFDNSPASPRGQGMASFLFGIPASGSLQIPAASNFADMSFVYAPFFQDSWKVTRKLTLTLGLRYEYETAETERYNRAVMGFNPSAGMPWAQQVQANYAANPTPEISTAQFLLSGGLNFPSANGHGQPLHNTDANNIMPRVGFAYSLNDKTVIRGGFGSYFGSLGTRIQDVIQNSGFLSITNFIPTLNNGVTYVANISDPFPNGFVQPTGASLGSQTNVGNAISFFNQSPKAARLAKFQMDIQREFPGQVVLDVGYAGSRNYDLEVSRSLSATPNQFLSTSPFRDQTTINYLTANMPNPFFGIPQFTGTTRGGSNTIARSVLLSPYPQFAGVSYYTYDGRGWYNALNVRVEKRFSRGFMTQMTYTFSKFLEATSLLNPGDALPARAPSSQDYPHHISIAGIYELPFGQGRHFLPNVHSVANVLLSNWQIAPIYTYQSGAALGFGNAILTCPLSAVPISGHNSDKIRQWFNTSCFNRNTAQQLANNLITLSPRFGGIRGDSSNSWDASLIKETPIKEKVQLELRFEALNLFNQVNFANPNTSPTSSAFGQVTAQYNVPRHLQLSLRLKF